MKVTRYLLSLDGENSNKKAFPNDNREKMLILHHNSNISKVTHGDQSVDVSIVKLCPKFVTLQR